MYAKANKYRSECTNIFAIVHRVCSYVARTNLRPILWSGVGRQGLPIIGFDDYFLWSGKNVMYGSISVNKFSCQLYRNRSLGTS